MLFFLFDNFFYICYASIKKINTFICLIGDSYNFSFHFYITRFSPTVSALFVCPLNIILFNIQVYSLLRNALTVYYYVLSTFVKYNSP